MDAMGKIGAGLLIVLLLPTIVAEWEGRRLPEIFHAMLGAGGLGFAAWTGGLGGFGVSVLVGTNCFLLLGVLVTAAASLWSIRPLTGSNIRLFAAGSFWLAPSGALVMLFLVAALFVASAVILRMRKGTAVRPGLAPIFASAMLGTFLLLPLFRSIAA